MRKAAERTEDGIKTIRRFPGGVVAPPPSKSLSHRAVICAALAARESGAIGGGIAQCGADNGNTDSNGPNGRGRESVIYNLGASEDVEATLEGIKALGVCWERGGTENACLRVFHRGGVPDTVSNRRGGEDEPIDCAESGSTLRFLIPVFALEKREVCFSGRGRLLERPLDVYRTAFAEAGAELAKEPDRVRVRGPLRSGVFTIPGDVSSQFVSGLLFALPLLDGDSEIRLSSPLESRGYAELTVDVMERFGVRVQAPDEYRFLISGGQRYRPAEYEVEADYSQAAYFLAAAALGRDVWCSGLNPDSRQGDRAILRVLEEMGAGIVRKDDLVSVRARRLKAVNVDAREIPDLVPPIAALCCFCEGASRIENAGRLRLKESDRLKAMTSELSKLGASVIEKEDGLIIEGSGSLRGGRVDAWNDHRIAMSMALAAIRCEGPVELSGWRSVSKSYPGFWDDFERDESI